MDMKTVNSMVCLVKLEILESAEELKEILSRQTELKLKQKVQALYWLKIEAADTIEYISTLLGCHRTTVSRWFAKYRKCGMEGLLNKKKIVGRPRKMSSIIENKLIAELEEIEGFNSYNEVQKWLKAVCDIHLPYSTVHRYVYYHLKAKLKVPRPVSSKQKPRDVEQFKKKCQNC
ncbi:MAG: helix-turn-helix domain-containing protein [Cyanobacteriota bacterium]|nr:helix-turn-helix domain-containing protein [Cyanobacteriota bacterium]